MKFEQPNLEKFYTRPEKEEKEKISKEIFERITKHSQELDKEITQDPLFSKEEIEKNWRKEEWQIGETKIEAIGVVHVPEIFLYKREEIEKTIQESDIVVSEFTPEALGMYDKTQDKHLKNIKSRFNEHYNLAELRKAYLRFENSKVLRSGVFYHEIELLTAKYGKDLACFDFEWSQTPERLLQDHFIYAKAAEELADLKARFKKTGLYGGTFITGLAGLAGLLKDLKLKKPISRRTFLKMGLVGVAGLVVGVTPEITKTPPKKAEKIAKEEAEKEAEKIKRGEITKRQLFDILRNLSTADSLSKLPELGYKKITLIYGVNHLKEIKWALDNPEKRKEFLFSPEIQQLIKKHNPDYFKIFKLSPGKNHSEKFVASKDLVWKRIK